MAGGSVLAQKGKSHSVTAPLQPVFEKCGPSLECVHTPVGSCHFSLIAEPIIPLTRKYARRKLADGHNSFDYLKQGLTEVPLLPNKSPTNHTPYM